MIRFYAPEIADVPLLPEEESAHCCRVLRLREGDNIEVVDGCGNIYCCAIVEAHPKHTRLEIISHIAETPHWKPCITLAVAPTKNMDRMEWLAEKAVEIGVNRLVFLNCKNSVRRVVKTDRIQKIFISAMKQSLKATLPAPVEMVDIREFLKKCDSAAKYVGYCDDATERKEFASAYNGRSDISILIGPEGDFTSEEISEAFKAGFIPVTFGNTRLRTETAALFALCATHTLIQKNSIS